VGLVFRLAELLIVIAPLAGVLIAAVKAMRRGAQSRDQPQTTGPGDDTVASPSHRNTNARAQWSAITRAVEKHAQTDARWLDYELDVAKLLDFPVMTDMRDPLTVAFHRAKLRAELLRPVRAEFLVDDRPSAIQYFDAVEDYVTAFDAAETEAKRRRRNDFSSNEQNRIARGQRLLRMSSDSAATTQERAHAYELACKELDGLIVLPAATRLQIERGIAGEIDG
jgi:hypothetical protein